MDKKYLDSIKWGEIYLVDFGKSKGARIKGVHPAIIVQNNIGNKYSPCTNIIPLDTYTEHHKELDYLYISVSPNESGLSESLIAHINELTVINKSQIIKKAGDLRGKKIMNTIVKALMERLNLFT